MSWFNRINLGFRNQKAPDGRLRITEQLLLGDYKLFNDPGLGQFDIIPVAGGGFSYEGDGIGSNNYTVTTTGDAVVSQSYQWHNYFAGKPQKIELTASNFHLQTNVVKRFGYFSSNIASPYDSNKDGFFFESDGTNISVNVYRNGTQVYTLPQSSWDNQSDLSGFLPENFNFYEIEFIYLGGAVVNFSVFTSKGLVKVASYQHINIDKNTFVKSPNQPIRYEIRSTGGAGSFNQTCASVTSEGLSDDAGAVRTYNTGTTLLSSLATSTRYAVLGVRHATRVHLLDFLSASVLAGTADDLLVELYFGGTTVGTPTWLAVGNSNMDAFSGTTLGAVANAVHSGGVLINSFYVTGNGVFAGDIKTTRKLGIFLNGNSEESFLTVTPMASNASAVGSVSWREFI